MSEIYHVPVLLKEAVEFLQIKKGGQYIDCTLGGGGHTELIIEKGGSVLGIDHDPEAIEFTRKRLIQACPTPPCQQAEAGSLGAFRWTLVKDNFVNLTKIARENNYFPVEGILMDLGVSSHQLEIPQRGFSFNVEADLDMRMDPDLQVTALDLVNGLNEGELYELFVKLGEEHFSRRLARAVCCARRVRPIRTCNQLAEIVLKSVPSRKKFGRIHPATRVFQALRIAVNDELNNLKETLPQTIDLLKKGGRLVIISFHSLEDKIIKDFINQQEVKGIFKNLLTRPMVPEKEEIIRNPRSRSAKLRVAEKIKS